MNDSVRIRVCFVVVDDDEILLVPHYNTDAGPVQWVIPGGKLEFGESLREAASREFFEETGLQAEITHLFDVGEVILPETVPQYHNNVLRQCLRWETKARTE